MSEGTKRTRPKLRVHVRMEVILIEMGTEGEEKKSTR